MFIVLRTKIMYIHVAGLDDKSVAWNPKKFALYNIKSMLTDFSASRQDRRILLLELLPAFFSAAGDERPKLLLSAPLTSALPSIRAQVNSSANTSS